MNILVAVLVVCAAIIGAALFLNRRGASQG